MDDATDLLPAARRFAWWITDITVCISFSFSVLAHVCQHLADDDRYDLRGSEHGLVMQFSQWLGYVALGWILISAILAITSRVRFGIGREISGYLVLLLLATIGVFSLE